MRQFGSFSRKTNDPLSWLRRYGLVSITVVFAMACSGQSPSDSDSDDNGGDDPKLESAQVFYVATGGGNDADPGTISAPWLTISHAAATLEPGDTVYVRAGFYAERVVPARSGQPGAYITYLAHPGEEVTIDGRTITLSAEWGGLFDITDRSYIKVAGFRVTYAGPGIQAVGILVDGSHHITIEDNETYNTVCNNIIYNATFIGISLATNGDSPVHPMQGIRIINNTITNCGLGEWGGGIFVESREVTDVTIRNNIVSGNLSFQIARETLIPEEVLVVDHNLIDGYREYEGEILGADSVVTDPLFVDAAAGDFSPDRVLTRP